MKKVDSIKNSPQDSINIESKSKKRTNKKENTNAISRVEAAIAAFKAGEMVIIMDDEDRENEGDLVLAGIFSTPQKINFMAKYARGLVCVSIRQELATALDLPPMVAKNSSNHETAFTISIDAKDAKTGISAYERDLTIKLMCAPNAAPSDFVRPGHIFPLIAKSGGVLERSGHTEASIDLCVLAGLKPISVICEIMREDGKMPGRGDKFLREFAKKHKLCELFVSDLIEYRLRHSHLVREVSRQNAVFFGHSCLQISFQDHAQREHMAFLFDFALQKLAPNCNICKRNAKNIADNGEFKAQNSSSIESKSKASAKNSNAPLVKFHILRGELEMLCGADFTSFSKSIELLAKEGGVLIALQDSGGDLRERGIGAQILRQLGVEKFRLLSESASKNKNDQNTQNAQISAFGLEIVEIVKV